MTGDGAHPDIARIDRAIARIETALTTRSGDHDRLAARHHALRLRIGDAVAALDSLIAEGADD